MFRWCNSILIQTSIVTPFNNRRRSDRQTKAVLKFWSKISQAVVQVGPVGRVCVTGMTGFASLLKAKKIVYQGRTGSFKIYYS